MDENHPTLLAQLNESDRENARLRARVLNTQAVLELNRDNITPEAFRAIADALKG